MSIQEQLEKVQSDLQKIEERRKELQQKEKELLTKLELEEARAAAKKNEEIRKIVEENYGEVDGSNLEIFRRVMQEQSGQMKQRKEHLLESDSNRKNMNFSVKKQRKIRKHGCGQEAKTCLLMSGKKHCRNPDIRRSCRSKRN